jgi:hypothetical protein
MAVCTFFGHRDCYSLDEQALMDAIEGHPKFAIERRNRWMIDQSDFLLCYINHTWGGAYKFARLAKRRGKTVINLGNPSIEL